MGVKVRLNSTIEAIDADGVTLAGLRLAARTVVWGAGIKAATGAEWIGGTDDRSGKIAVDDTLQVKGRDGIFALGDVALLIREDAPLPALAQVAQQQGNHLGRELRTSTNPLAYRYRSRGDTAVIGRHAAVYMIGRFKLTGRLAWLLWAIIHVYLLLGFERRTLVMLQWIWRYVTFERGARLID